MHEMMIAQTLDIPEECCEDNELNQRREFFSGRQ